MMCAQVSEPAFWGRRRLAALKLSPYAQTIFAKLRTVAPYALMEPILPGGSIMALLLWLYRRQRKVPAFATQEILALL